MYDAATRETYAQMFKLAEAKLPASVRELAVRASNTEPVIAKALTDHWSRR